PTFILASPAARYDPHSFPTRRSSDLGDHAHREGNGEDPRPEAGKAVELLFARPHPEQQQHRDIGGKTDGEGREDDVEGDGKGELDRKSTRLNSSHVKISYAVFCLKKK